jgi:hypothetical protein
MRRWLWVVSILLSGVIPIALAQQDPAKTDTVTTTCTFQDEKQISLRYEPPALAKGKELPQGVLWPPSGSPMYLFTQTGITVGGTELPPAAYSLYVIPGRKTWTLIVNKSVTAGAPYDQQQDLLRAPMEVDALTEPQPFQLTLGHIAPQECSLGVYAGKAGGSVVFKEK